MKLALLSIAVSLVLQALPGFCGQAAVNVIGRKELIPSGYKTYSLFLICNPAWLDPSSSTGLTDLYHQFQSFGRSIGDDQAAVWFWKTTVNPGWEKVAAPADVIDVERSINFCKAWNLKPSDGPYVVVTSARPDEQHLSRGLPDDSAIFKLGGMKPSEISSLLEKLTDSLLLSGKVDSSVAVSSAPSSGSSPSPSAPAPTVSTSTATGTAAASSALWIRMLSATQQLINEFGCAWSFKVNAGPLSADLKSCKGSS